MTHLRPAPLIGRPAAQSLRNQTLLLVASLPLGVPDLSSLFSLLSSLFILLPSPSHLIHILSYHLHRIIHVLSWGFIHESVFHSLPVVVILALPIMKAPCLLAAAALLAGGTSAEVHKLKLNKVPLEEQLVSRSMLDDSAPIPIHAHAVQITNIDRLF